MFVTSVTSSNTAFGVEFAAKEHKSLILDESVAAGAAAAERGRAT